MSTSTAVRTISPADEVRSAITRMEPEFRAALPSHIPVEKFSRVALTAINSNPELLNADRRSLFGSCVKMATDGLLPDGREAALVIFNKKEKVDGKDVWIKAVQYMPMIFGILKRARNSGEIATIGAHIVHAGDTFKHFVNETGEHFSHEPTALGGERGAIDGVYAFARTKDGELYFEAMTKADVEKVRAVSKTKDFGPWKEWWEEMAKKTVLRRLSKRLPLSTDIDTIIRRDDELYDLDQKPAQIAPPPRPTRADFGPTPEQAEAAGVAMDAEFRDVVGDPTPTPAEEPQAKAPETTPPPAQNTAPKTMRAVVSSNGNPTEFATVPEWTAAVQKCIDLIRSADGLNKFRERNAECFADMENMGLKPIVDEAQHKIDDKLSRLK